MGSIGSTAASASSSLASQNFLVKILVHALLLQRLLSSSRNVKKIITATSIPISCLLRISQYLLYFQKRCRSKHDSTIPRLRNNVFFGISNGIEVLISPKSELYDFSHAAVRSGHLILGDVISSMCRQSGGNEGGGGGMNADLPYGKTVIHIVTISLLDSFSSCVRYSLSSNAHYCPLTPSSSRSRSRSVFIYHCFHIFAMFMLLLLY